MKAITGLMTDQELADAIVARGVAHTSEIRATDFGENPRAETIYILNTGLLSACNPKQFVRDWRTAGAMIELCETGEFVRLENGLWAVGIPFPKTNREAQAENESLPRAINEACVEALQ